MGAGFGATNTGFGAGFGATTMGLGAGLGVTRKPVPGGRGALTGLAGAALQATTVKVVGRQLERLWKVQPELGSNSPQNTSLL